MENFIFILVRSLWWPRQTQPCCFLSQVKLRQGLAEYLPGRRDPVHLHAEAKRIWTWFLRIAVWMSKVKNSNFGTREEWQPQCRAPNPTNPRSPIEVQPACGWKNSTYSPRASFVWLDKIQEKCTGAVVDFRIRSLVLWSFSKKLSGFCVLVRIQTVQTRKIKLILNVFAKHLWFESMCKRVLFHSINFMNNIYIFFSFLQILLYWIHAEFFRQRVLKVHPFTS